MKVRSWLNSTLAVVYIVILLVCTVSGSMHESDAPGRQIPAFLSKRVSFLSGSFPVSAEELTLTVTADELNRLDEFQNLKSVDFSGSTCYGEILAWAAAHPNINVRYTVQLPGGMTVQNNIETLDLSSVRHDTVTSAAAVLPYLPKLKNVELGSASQGGDLTGSDLGILSAACPNASYYYAFSIAGKDVSLNDESIDLRGIKQEEIEDAAGLLSCMSKLSTVELGSESSYSPALRWEDIQKLEQSCPTAVFNYSFSLFGHDFTLMSESMDFNHIKMDDEGAAVRRALACMPKCTYLDMDSCGVSDASMEAIRTEFPDVDVVWRIWFGDNYSVRTDVEKILASKPSVGGLLHDKDIECFKYCTKVKYLDIGHNEPISTCEFAAYMPELEVLIIPMCEILDLSPLANCHKLEYLEIFSSNISDLTPLSGLTELRHLNIQNMPMLSDISPLFSLSGLERLWIGMDTHISADQIDRMQSAAPNCVINTTSDSTMMENWRFTRYDPNIPKYYWVPRYELLREQMGYNYQEYSFYWLDEKCGEPAPPQFSGMYGKAASGG